MFAVFAWDPTHRLAFQLFSSLVSFSSFHTPPNSVLSWVTYPFHDEGAL
jgi:hypothetical protein